ncbi:flagellar basal body-associated FliL family protein [bacterium]|nr:flagellar basal body-associated FliL family protein [bacterium]
MNEADQDVASVELPENEMPEGGAPSGGGSRGLSMPIFIGILVGIVALQGFSSWTIMNWLLEANPYFPGGPPMEEENLTGLLYTIEGIIVNPTDSKGTKILLVDIGFETGSDAVVAEMGSMEPLLRDNINTFLSAQRLPVLSDISYRDKIRDRVQQIANHHLTSGKVGRVFFVRYVLQ